MARFFLQLNVFCLYFAIPKGEIELNTKNKNKNKKNIFFWPRFFAFECILPLLCYSHR